MARIRTTAGLKPCTQTAVILTYYTTLVKRVGI